MKVLPIALGAGAVYLLASSAFNKAQALKNLTYGNPKIKVKSLSLTNMELEMQIDITNPNSASITLDYFTGIVRYQGAQLTSFTFNANGKNTVIKGRQITTIPFTLLVKNFSAIGAIIKLIDSLAQSKKVSTVLSVSGSLFAAGIDVPVNFDYDIKNNAVVAAPKVSGVEAKLNFSSNAEMEKYFSNRKAAKLAKVPAFSKN